MTMRTFKVRLVTIFFLGNFEIVLLLNRFNFLGMYFSLPSKGHAQFEDNRHGQVRAHMGSVGSNGETMVTLDLTPTLLEGE